MTHPEPPDTAPTVTVPATPEAGSSSEPLINVGTITAGTAALVALLVAFGLRLSDVQTGAILALVTVVAPLVVALVGRRRVYSPTTTRVMVMDAADQGRIRLHAAEIPAQTPPATTP